MQYKVTISITILFLLMAFILIVLPAFLGAKEAHSSAISGAVCDLPSGRQSLSGIIAISTPPGETLYDEHCAACHEENGKGDKGVIPPLAGHAPRIVANEKGRKHIIRLILFGMNGPIDIDGTHYDNTMPPFETSLSDSELAILIQYILTNWGNEETLGKDFLPITTAEISAQRKKPAKPEDIYHERENLSIR